METLVSIIESSGEKKQKILRQVGVRIPTGSDKAYVTVQFANGPEYQEPPVVTVTPLRGPQCTGGRWTEVFTELHEVTPRGFMFHTVTREGVEVAVPVHWAAEGLLE